LSLYEQSSESEKCMWHNYFCSLGNKQAFKKFYWLAFLYIKGSQPFLELAPLSQK